MDLSTCAVAWHGIGSLMSMTNTPRYAIWEGNWKLYIARQDGDEDDPFHTPEISKAQPFTKKQADRFIASFRAAGTGAEIRMEVMP